MKDRRSLNQRWGKWLARRYGWKCHYCGAPLIPHGHHVDDQYTANYKRDGKRTPRPPYRFSTVDHKIPRSRDGGETIDNLVLACVECNREKAEMTDIEYRVYLREKAKK